MPATHSDPPAVDLPTLVGLFYDNASRLGRFRAVDGDALPEPFGELLNHYSHMTVTVEKFHDSLVDVRVARTRTTPPWYAREITLVTRDGGQVVQYGIVRLNYQALDEPVWREIESQKTPLGRVLIQHNVLRELELCRLWEVTAGPALAEQLQLDLGEVTYGRTARIFCNHEPAIELLEIVRVR